MILQLTAPVKITTSISKDEEILLVFIDTNTFLKRLQEKMQDLSLETKLYQK